MQGIETWIRSDCHWASSWCAADRHSEEFKDANPSKSVIVRMDERKVQVRKHSRVRARQSLQHDSDSVINGTASFTI